MDKTASIPMLILALAGCGRQQDTETLMPSQGTNATAVAASPSNRAASRSRVLPIADGIRAPHEFNIRSRGRQAEPGADGSITRVLRLELDKLDADAAAAMLRDAFEKKGYRLLESSEDGGIFTNIVRSSNGVRVRYVITPKDLDLKVLLSSVGAQGLVTLYWKEPAGK